MLMSDLLYRSKHSSKNEEEANMRESVPGLVRVLLLCITIMAICIMVRNAAPSRK